MKMRVAVDTAVFYQDSDICQIAKQSRYTRDFSSHMFFRNDIEHTYAKGEVGVAVNASGGAVVGFVYCKHVKRGGEKSVIHYMGVDQQCRELGIGRRLLEWAKAEATKRSGILELSCEESNEGAMNFYRSCGFAEHQRGTYGTKNPRPYVRFRWTAPRPGA